MPNAGVSGVQVSAAKTLTSIQSQGHLEDAYKQQHRNTFVRTICPCGQKKEFVAVSIRSNIICIIH